VEEEKDNTSSVGDIVRGSDGSYYKVKRHIKDDIHQSSENMGELYHDNSSGKYYLGKDGEFFDELEPCDSEGNPIDDVPSVTNNEEDETLTAIRDIDMTKKVLYDGEKVITVYHGAKDGKDITLRIIDKDKHRSNDS
jgi:hypothetical protein